MELDNSKLQQELLEIKEQQKNYSGKSLEELVELYNKEAYILKDMLEEDKKRLKEKLAEFHKNKK